MISLSRMARLFSLKAFFKDKRGVSAIEFALIAPILIMAYLGLAEVTLGMMASRRTAHLAASLGDLAAQSDSLTSANITDLFTIGNSMMAPFRSDSTVLNIRLTSVTMNASNQAVVQWSVAQGTTLPAYSKTKPDIISAITTNQIASGQSLIMTEVDYRYTSPLGNFLPGQSAFKDTFYHHPRNGAAVACSTC
jgi:Flp pilus assembly protein TadG